MTILYFFEALGSDLKSQTESFLSGFIETGLGKMAVDAVNYAETIIQPDDEKRDAAKTQLLNDAEAAGIDLIKEGASVLNFLSEAALQAVTAKVVATAI